MAFATELDDRITKCNRILEENPNSQIFAALAEAYRKKGELDRAFRTCQGGLRIHPNYGSGHVVMAKINFDKGLYDWAEIEINKTIELDGTSHTTDLLLAEVLIYKGEFNRAIKILNRLSAEDANNPQVKKLIDIARKLPAEAARKIEIPKKREVILSAPEKPAELRPVNKLSLKQFMDELAAVPHIEGVLLINKDGLVADRRWDDANLADMFGAIGRDIEKTIQSQIEICKFGAYENILLESQDLIINFISIRGSLLLIKASRQINLGTLRLKLTSLLGRLADDQDLT
jgi:predicted regulator of Ras-like GTPase activity (Roadblock/LC7/MglB family)